MKKQNTIIYTYINEYNKGVNNKIDIKEILSILKGKINPHN